MRYFKVQIKTQFHETICHAVALYYPDTMGTKF